MVRGCVLIAPLAFGLSVAVDGAFGQETVKIGFILPMTGQQQSTGKQEAAGDQALHGAARRHGRRQKNRAHPPR